jgi:hypothetical protein
MTLDDVSKRLELDADTTRWLVRLLYEEGTELSRIGDRPLPRGTPVYTEATADVIEIQRAMARNHVRTLFVIQAQDALATVNIVDLALLIEALIEASDVSNVSESMPQELGDATTSVPVVGNGSGVTVCDYGHGFTIKCSGRLGVIAAEELRSSVEHCVDRNRPLSKSTSATSRSLRKRAWTRSCLPPGVVAMRGSLTSFLSTLKGSEYFTLLALRS